MVEGLNFQLAPLDDYLHCAAKPAIARSLQKSSTTALKRAARFTIVAKILITALKNCESHDPR